MIPAPADIARLLSQWGEGDSEALDQLIPIVYERLHELAHQRLRNEREAPSLNTTGLVHEAYLKLSGTPRGSLRDRGHFLALASRVMRNLLVDHARARAAMKRGGGLAPVELEEACWIPADTLTSAAELDDALLRLEALDPRQSRMLELRYFGGLTLDETAGALGVSLATVKRELRSARAWLAVELGGEPPVG